MNKKIELKEKLSEIITEIGNLTNYQDSGAKKYAARGIMLYILREISEQEEIGNIFVIEGKENFDIKDVYEIINNL